jgi:hypothetical protein
MSHEKRAILQTVIFLAASGFASGSDNVLMLSYGPFLGSAIQAEPPPIIAIYRRKVLEKWDAGVVAGDLNLAQNGVKFLEADGLRYFGENNSGFTVGLSYYVLWVEDWKKKEAFFLHSVPIGLGYMAKWTNVVHDFYVGYGPSFSPRGVSTMAVGHLAFGFVF